MTVRDALLPEIAEVISLLPFEHMDADALATMRSFAVEMPVADGAERRELAVPPGSDPAAEPEVPLSLHRPAGAGGPLPCLYSMHGGGYVIGSYTMEGPSLDRLATGVGIAGVAVEYRLAPETPYPGPLEDCYRGLRWTYDHAEELGIDPDRIGIGGTSAGGGLAAALALLARDRGEVPVAFQLLDCPMLDDRQATPSSRRDDLQVWTRVSNEFGWRSYLGDLYGGDVPYTAAPGRASDLSGLPPAFVSVGSLDGFLDEDVDYAMRLLRAGVPCELHVYPGACHGYQIAAESDLARQSRRDVAGWVARQSA
jgi:triacylglycerol lipase